MTPQPKIPRYSQSTLIRIMNDCKTIKELEHVGKLYKELSEAGDFIITYRMKAASIIKYNLLLMKKDFNSDTDTEI